MKLRTALVSGTTAAFLTAACQPSLENGVPDPSYTRPVTNFKFQADPLKSDIYLAINCNDRDASHQEPYGISISVLTPTATDASVVATLGFSDQKVDHYGKLKSGGKLLGGVSVRGALGHDETAYSDGTSAVTSDPAHQRSRTISAGDQSAVISFAADPVSSEPFMSLVCLPPLTRSSV